MASEDQVVAHMMLLLEKYLVDRTDLLLSRISDNEKLDVIKQKIGALAAFLKLVGVDVVLPEGFDTRRCRPPK